jgi:hypothetical protein
MSDHLMSLGANGVDQPENYNVTGGNMLFTTRDGPYLIDQGVYVNNGPNYTGSAINTLAFNVTLSKDKYWALAFPGQNTLNSTYVMPYNTTGFIPDLVLGNITLVANAFTNTSGTYGNTAGLNSLMVRGFPTTCYSYDRTSTSATATWGDLVQTITIDPPAANNSVQLAFDYGLGLDMEFNMTIPSSQYTFSNVTTTFQVAKTSISGLTYYPYNGSAQSYSGNTYADLDGSGTIFSSMMSSDPDALSTVPWLDLIGLNNIFYPNVNNMNITVDYQQSAIMTSYGQFNCDNSSTSALNFATGNAYNATAYVEDSQLPGLSYAINTNTNAVMTLDQNYVLRNTSNSFYVEVAPIDVMLQWKNYTALGVTNSLTVTTNYALTYNVSSIYNVTCNNISAAYILNVPSLQPFRNTVRSTAPTSNIAANWQYTPNLVTLKGVQQDGTGAFNVTNIYFSNQNLAAPTQIGGSNNLVWNTTSTFPGTPAPPFTPQYMVSLRQSGAATSSGDEVAFVFSSNNLLPTYTNGEYQFNNASLCVGPDQQVVMTHYDLAWNMNPTTLKLEPTVYKYNCVPSDYNYYGATGSAFNVYDGNSIGYINNVNILNVSQMVVNSTFTSVMNNLDIKYPYLAIDQDAYPALNTNNVGNVAFTSFNQTSLFNITANSDFSYKIVNTAGRDLWHEYFIVPADNFTDAKVVNVFNRDQLAVVGAGSGNDRPLLMRVGPDGVLYTSDVSAYGYLATNIPSNAAQQYDGVNAPLFNSNVNLGQF